LIVDDTAIRVILSPKQITIICIVAFFTLLKYSNLSLEEIADDIGFSDHLKKIP